MDELTRLKLPICLNHDLSAQPIGSAEMVSGCLVVTFVDGARITPEQAMAAFGNVGCTFDRDGEYVKSLTIFEFSVAREVAV